MYTFWSGIVIARGRHSNSTESHSKASRLLPTHRARRAQSSATATASCKSRWTLSSTTPPSFALSAACSCTAPPPRTPQGPLLGRRRRTPAAALPADNGLYGHERGCGAGDVLYVRICHPHEVDILCACNDALLEFCASVFETEELNLFVPILKPREDIYVLVRVVRDCGVLQTEIDAIDSRPG